MTVVIGVPITLLGRGRARADAGLQQAVNNEMLGVTRSRQDPRRDVAHIGAIEAEGDASA